MRIKFILWTLLLSGRLLGQISISGYVTDANSGEALISANVYDKNTLKGTTTNEYGYFFLEIPENTVELSINYVGYEEHQQRIAESTTLTVALKPQTLQTVEVTASKGYTKPALSVINIPVKELERIPVLAGEVDLLKSLTFTPGISSGVEGTSSILVRGGSPDQNLVLLDGATIYNASHLFGFVSAFNSDAIKSLNVYKGAFPAEYGGRLSSVLDIRMKEGNKKKTEGAVSIGLISSKLLLEGPILKDKASFLIAGRASYLGLFLLPSYFSYKRGATEEFANYWLYDTNTKLNYKISDKHHLFLSGYLSNDFLNSRSRAGSGVEKGVLNWGNRTLSLRHTGVLKKNLFWKNDLVYSRYKYRFGAENIISDTISSITSYSLSSLEDFTFKSTLEYSPNDKHYLKFGGQAILHRYRNQLNSGSGDIQFLFDAQNKPLEYAAFISDEISITPALTFESGIRLTGLATSSKNYNAIEPRLNLNLRLPNDWTAGAAYTYMNQYIHLLASNSAGLPNDIWVPSTASTPPAKAQQVSVGLSKTFDRQGLKFSAEGYWKTYQDLISYRQGTNFLSGLNTEWEDIIERGGAGKSYGLETMVEKKQGDFTGWMAYTLAWSNRRFDNINEGRNYPFKYDRRHDFSITTHYKASEKWSLSANWVFNTGNPVTLPIAFIQNEFDNDGQTALYGDRNNARMPVYHRLDLGFIRTWENQKGRTKSLSFGLYNAYNRANPFYLDFEQNTILDDDFGEYPITVATDRKLVRRGVFPILPYINYKLKF